MSVIEPILQHPKLIGYFLGANNYCWLHFSNGEKKLLAKPISYMERKLPAFIRIHKTVLVNPACIASWHEPTHKKKAGKVCLTTGEEFPVSRRRWPLLVDVFQRHSTDEATVTDSHNSPALSLTEPLPPVPTRTVILITDDSENGKQSEYMMEQKWPDYQFYVTRQSASLPDYIRQLPKAEFPVLLLLDARTTTTERFNTLQALKQDEQLSRVPVVMLVLPTDQFVVKSYQQQANSVVSMPVGSLQFRQTIERICHFWLTIVQLPGVQ